jgi:gamma-glutamylcyclotransferase (GGCT)/AIG2-like uncharacterized protein YtfP
MLPLFAYGTLRDADYQRALFDRTYPMRPATVTGFIVLSTGGGYLAATPRESGSISGAIVELDAAGYAIADAWEDLRVYARIEVEANGEDGPQRCLMYVRPDTGGELVADERTADLPRADVFNDIARFRSSR